MLEVRDLHVHYAVSAGVGRRGHVVRAVDGVGFDLAAGETLGLVGESGCGKTSLARALVRLVPATAGRITFEGQDIALLRGASLRAWRRRVQIVFQDVHGALNPRLTVGSAIGEVLRVHDIARGPNVVARVNELLERVGLEPRHRDAYPHELSGGQRQRVNIARALAVAPALLVLDEPVSALDVSVQAQILNMLCDLQADLGLTYVFVSHDLRVIRHVSHRVAVMYLGRIVETGPVDTVFAAPQHPYTRSLLASVPVLRAGPNPLPALAGEVPSPTQIPPGCRFHPRCPEAILECAVTDPPEIDVAPHHRVACLLVSPFLPGASKESGAASGP